MMWTKAELIKGVLQTTIKPKVKILRCAQDDNES